MQVAPSLCHYPPEPAAGSLYGGRRGSGIRQERRGPLVSVITVVRNGERRLQQAIGSVLAQDYPHLEYIVVDGDSTDGTLEVVRGHAHRIDLWISERDSGISDAFNKGIALSRGEIVGLLNSDDWYERGAISAAVENLEATGADIAHGQMQYWEGNRKTYLVSGDADVLDRGMTIGHPTVFARRACYERFGLYRLDFTQAMDYEWLLRAKVQGARFSFVNRCIANMRCGGLGDRRWRQSQLEVARARGIHLPSARGAIPYYSYVCAALAKGTIRRTLDSLKLNAARRWYHRHVSRVSITESKNERLS